MSVFTKQAFTMSAMPTPANSAPPSAPVSRRPSFTYPASGTMTPAVDPHIVQINVESVLFDMDGTLINSSPAVVKAWTLFSESYPLDLDDILKSAHGMRTIDVLKKWCHITDPELLEKEVVRFETAILDAAEEIAKSGGDSTGIEVLPGVRKLLDDLSSEKDARGGEEKWAICTSSTYFYAGRAIPIAGLTTPKIFVTADSVTRGKPFPDPYLLGAAGCNASPFESLVVEDAPTGIRAGKAAGSLVLATCTSHDRAALEKERPDFLVDDLSKVTASWDAETNTFKLIIEQPVDRAQPKATPDVTPVVTPAGSRMNSFSGGRSGDWKFPKGSDELTGNDSVVGSPAASRPGSRPASPPGDKEEGADIARRPSQQGVTLEAFKRAFAGNAKKNRSELQMDE
ncbi:putative phosphatase [Papiliotrema laurentii]|uniref:Phosphatase n=1 Tax=Papiliotrema laurentii TaxID=5418 RepID=A0AAD9FV26_PAPLA|nr:putative phosphatase [Papiliotrema laurentii]